MSYQERCKAIDRQKSMDAYGHGGAWMGLNFADPENEAEKKALDYVKKRWPRSITISIYEIVEVIAEEFHEGL